MLPHRIRYNPSPNLNQPKTKRQKEQNYPISTNPFQYSQQNNNPILPIIQYKNATYYGQTNKINQRQGIGIMIYDNGDILLGTFKNDNINGFFIFFSCSVEYKQDKRNLCMYGSLIDDKLQGECFLYSRNKKIASCVLKAGQIIQNNFQQPKKHSKNNLLSISKPQNKQQKTNCLTPAAFIFYHLSSFEQKIINSQSQSSYQQTKPIFKLFEIQKNQLYYGTVGNNKPNGFGIIFVNQWPVCYGKFYDGKLNGLARVQQNPNTILDGIFQANLLKIGWFINLKDNVTCNGVLVKNEGNSKARNIFQLTQQFTGIQMQKISKFRRRQHLISLHYSNSYTMDFPQKVKNQLISNLQKHLKELDTKSSKKHHIVDSQVDQNFIPSFISEISRVQIEATPRSRASATSNNKDTIKDRSTDQVQRDLLDLIKQYNQNKNSYEKVSKALSHRVKDTQKLQQSDIALKKIVPYYPMTPRQKYSRQTNSQIKIPLSTQKKQSQNIKIEQTYKILIFKAQREQNIQNVKKQNNIKLTDLKNVQKQDIKMKKQNIEQQRYLHVQAQQYTQRNQEKNKMQNNYGKEEKEQKQIKTKINKTNKNKQQKQIKVKQVQKNTGKRLNLHEIYNKYLRKQ